MGLRFDTFLYVLWRNSLLQHDIGTTGTQVFQKSTKQMGEESSGSACQGSQWCLLWLKKNLKRCWKSVWHPSSGIISLAPVHIGFHSENRAESIHSLTPIITKIEVWALRWIRALGDNIQERMRWQQTEEELFILMAGPLLGISFISSAWIHLVNHTIWSLRSAGCSRLCRIFPGTQASHLAAIVGTSGEKVFYQWCWHPALGFGNPAPILPRDKHCNHASGFGESSSCSSANKSKYQKRTVRDTPQPPVPPDASSIGTVNCCWRESTWHEVKSWPTQHEWWREVRGNKLSWADKGGERSPSPRWQLNQLPGVVCSVRKRVNGNPGNDKCQISGSKWETPCLLCVTWKQHGCCWWYSTCGNKVCHCPGWYFEEKSLVVQG